MQRSKQNSKPAESQKPSTEARYSNAFKTKAEADAFRQELTQALVDNLNRQVLAENP